MAGVPPCARTIPAARDEAPAADLARARRRRPGRRPPPRAKTDAQPPIVPAPTTTRSARSATLVLRPAPSQDRRAAAPAAARRGPRPVAGAQPSSARGLDADRHDPEPGQAVERRPATDGPGGHVETGRSRPAPSNGASMRIANRRRRRGSRARPPGPPSAGRASWLLSQRGQAGASVRDPLQGGRLERRDDRGRQRRDRGRRPAPRRPSGPGSPFSSMSRNGRRPTASRTSARVGMPSALERVDRQRVDPLRPAVDAAASVASW